MDLQKIGAWSAFGALLGLAVGLWAEGINPVGMTGLIVVGMLVGAVLRGVFGYVFGSSGTEKKPED